MDTGGSSSLCSPRSRSEPKGTEKSFLNKSYLAVGPEFSGGGCELDLPHGAKVRYQKH